MVSVHCLIFSKDRAMQLDALLRSMKRFAPGFWPPTILWIASSERSYFAYRVLSGEYPDCRWMAQGMTMNFILDVLLCLETQYSMSAMLVDDCVFFRGVPDIAVQPGTSYSMRFGDGVIDSYVTPSGPPQRVGGYSLDGNVHLTEELRGAIASIRCDGPNMLEACLNMRTDLTVQEVHGPENCLVNIPHNLVQSVFPNSRNMGGSAIELIERFLSGERIDLEAMDFSHVIDCHQPIPLMFRRIG